MTLKKVVFNARSSSEILTLDWRARRITQPPRPTANKIMSTSRMPPRFKAAPILRPTKWFERDKIVLNQVYFETIVFEGEWNALNLVSYHMLTLHRVSPTFLH